MIDEKHFMITSDPTELINYRFEGYNQVLIDNDMNDTERYCGPDEHIAYVKEDVADFHIDFVQHYERIRQHSDHIQFQKVKHENEGYYECTVRLHNGLVGVRVFFLTVGGGPRQVSNRETHLHSEVNDSITILCPIFSALPAWFTFIVPKDSAHGISTNTGHDYLQIKHLTTEHSGKYTCRVTTMDDDDGYSLTSHLHLVVYGPPESHGSEHTFLSIERNIENILRCAIDGNPTPSYRWASGDVNIPLKAEEILSHRRDYVIIPNENDAPGSNRTVTCIAENNRGAKRQVFTLHLIN